MFREIGQEGSIVKAIDILSAQIKTLENELAGNLKLVGIIKLQIKAIFLDARTKFEIAPPLQPAKLEALHQALQLKTRNITVATGAGTGANYEHPLKLDYNNPIEAVYFAPNSNCNMRFATRDGELGVLQPSQHTFVKQEIHPVGSVVAKIQVWCSASCIYGIRFFNKEGAIVLQSGSCSNSVQEIPLQEGERLLAIKSKTYDNSASSNYHHCNMVLVIGRME